MLLGYMYSTVIGAGASYVIFSNSTLAFYASDPSFDNWNPPLILDGNVYDPSPLKFLIDVNRFDCESRCFDEVIFYIYYCLTSCYYPSFAIYTSRILAKLLLDLTP